MIRTNLSTRPFYNDRLVRLGLNGFNERSDIFCGGAGVLGQFADLIGDNGEPAACFASAGGLDGGVESQQIRLLGDVVDDVDDFRDFE